MDALLMCGGDGSRLAADVEKPRFEIGGRPMVERVHDALLASEVEEVIAVTSPATPRTAATLDCPTVETPGDGYVPDLERALDRTGVTRPVLTVAADLPLLDGDAIDAVMSVADGSLTVAIPVGRKRALGMSVDTRFTEGNKLLAPAGLNVVGRDTDDPWVTRDPRYAVNVNRRRDGRVASWLLAE